MTDTEGRSAAQESPTSARAALALLHARYAGIIYDKCVRILQHRQEAEDAVQETFLKAFRAWDTFTYGPTRLPWLYRIATNVCLQALRRRARKGVEPLLDEVADDAADAEAITHARGIIERLAKELDDRHFEIIVAHYIDGMTQEETAAMIGISRRAVVKRLAWLRDCLPQLAVGGAHG